MATARVVKWLTLKRQVKVDIKVSNPWLLRAVEVAAKEAT